MYSIDVLKHNTYDLLSEGPGVLKLSWVRVNCIHTCSCEIYIIIYTQHYMCGSHVERKKRKEG